MELNYKSFGQGKPIVFLHGLFGMLDNWQTFGKKMAENDFLVYLVDQRGHGKSPSTNKFDYNVLSEDLKHFLDGNWIHECIIVGHSMGGKTAMQFTNDYPEYVNQLIVVDIAPKTYQAGHNEIFNALLSIDLNSTESRQNVWQHLQNKLPNESESTIQFLLKNLKRNKKGGFTWKMNVPLLKENYQNILDKPDISESIGVDTLFIKGEKSNYILDDDWKQIQYNFDTVDLVTIKDSSHWIHAQKPDELFKAIITFINK